MGLREGVAEHVRHVSYYGQDQKRRSVVVLLDLHTVTKPSVEIPLKCNVHILGSSTVPEYLLRARTIVAISIRTIPSSRVRHANIQPDSPSS